MERRIRSSIWVVRRSLVGLLLIFTLLQSQQPSLPIADLQGAGVPAMNCTVGQRYFNTTAAPGQNIYLCTAPNVWTQVTGGGAAFYQTVDDEAVALTQRAVVNFTGAGVTCVDNGGAARTDCTIPGFLPGGGIVDINALNPASQFLATGTAGADFNIASAVATHTFNLPDAGGAARGVVSTGAQTFAGKKTFTPVANFSGLNVGSLAGDPAVPANGDVVYNSVTNRFRCYENGAWANCIGAAGGGNVTYTGTYAALPAPGAVAAGDLYFPSDSFYQLRSTGVVWAYWGPLLPLVYPPALGSFTWVNQETATATTTNGGIALYGPGSATDDVRLLKMAAPATPYTITIAFTLTARYSDYAWAGFAWRQSSDGKLVVAGPHTAGLADFSVAKFADVNTYSAEYAGWNLRVVGPLLFIRATDNGVNRIVSISTDGQNFLQVHSVGRTDFLTADEVGFFVNSRNSTAIYLTLIHWSQT